MYEGTIITSIGSVIPQSILPNEIDYLCKGKLRFIQTIRGRLQRMVDRAKKYEEDLLTLTEPEEIEEWGKWMNAEIHCVFDPFAELLKDAEEHGCYDCRDEGEDCEAHYFWKVEKLVDLTKIIAELLPRVARLTWEVFQAKDYDNLVARFDIEIASELLTFKTSLQ